MTQYDISPDLLPNRITVERVPVGSVPDTGGAPGQQYTAVVGLTSLPASVQPMKSGKKAEYLYGELTVNATHTIVLLSVVGLKAGDRMRDERSRVFNLLGFGDDCGLGVLTAIDALIISGGGL